MSGFQKLVVGVFLQMQFFCVCGAKEVDDTKGLDLRLVSEQRVIAAGERFVVGVQIKHEDGFHTYWKNPGNVGMATSVKWTLPEGVSAGEIQWAYPDLSKMGVYPCHGYDRDVMLLVEMTAAEELSVSEVVLKGNFTWMCCAENCFPGNRALSITLPVGDKCEVDEGSVELFRQARKELPREDCPWKVSVLSKVDEGFVRLKFIPEGDGVKLEKPEYVFSEDGQVSSDKVQLFEEQEDGSYLLEVERSEFSPKGKKAFPGVFKVGNEYYRFSAGYKK